MFANTGSPHSPPGFERRDSAISRNRLTAISDVSTRLVSTWRAAGVSRLILRSIQPAYAVAASPRPWPLTAGISRTRDGEGVAVEDLAPGGDDRGADRPGRVLLGVADLQGPVDEADLLLGAFLRRAPVQSMLVTKTIRKLKIRYGAPLGLAARGAGFADGDGGRRVVVRWTRPGRNWEKPNRPAS